MTSYVVTAPDDPAASPGVPRPVATGNVHAFDIAGSAPARYVASGDLTGRLLGPSALSAYGGHLRAATTSGEGVSAQSAVTVLAERADRLVPVGRVGGLGPGETIRAIRWAGRWAGVVTFRRTDPLYVLDLADPVRPRVRGAVQLPGYSGYLHPVGRGLVLGAGQDADAEGRPGGVRLRSFDLADPAAPAPRDTLFLESGRLDAEADPHAFLYLPGRRLAVAYGWLRTAVRCAPAGDDGRPAHCRAGRVRLADGVVADEYPENFRGRLRLPGLVVVQVDTDGRLRLLARRPADAPVLGLVDVRGRLIVVTPRSVTAQDAADLGTLGAAVVNPSYEVNTYDATWSERWRQDGPGRR